jgi:radical SAM superfamily enzyme YgiQ (UPF0313 family)
MKRAGCWLIFYGFESGSQTILDNIGKKQTVEQGINAAILTRKAGIDMFGFFMIGNVGETEDTVFKTIRLVKKIRPRYFQCTLARPDPGSDLYKRYIREIGEAHIPWSKYYAFPQDSEGMGAVGTLLSVKELVELRDLMQLSLNRRGLCKRILKLLLRGEISKLIKALRVFLA